MDYELKPSPDQGENFLKFQLNQYSRFEGIIEQTDQQKNIDIITLTTIYIQIEENAIMYRIPYDLC